MGWNDHIDDDLNVLLTELISAGYLFEGGAAFDVAKNVISQGKTSLTPEELTVFVEQIVPALRALEEAKLEDNVEDALGPPPRD
jgi:hypothetical protein